MKKKVVQLASYTKGDAFVLMGEVTDMFVHIGPVPSPSLVVPPEEFYPQRPTNCRWNPEHHSVDSDGERVCVPFVSMYERSTWRPCRSCKFHDEDRLNGFGSLSD